MMIWIPEWFILTITVYLSIMTLLKVISFFLNRKYQKEVFKKLDDKENDF